MTWLVAACAIVLAAVLAAALYRERRRGTSLRMRLDAAAADLERMQVACSRLAPAGVVERLVADGSAAVLGAAERKVVTVLFADLVGYSAMSESLEPAAVARMLNGYFQRMSDAIRENGGHVAKFLGDGMFAYFGALHTNPWQCDDAVRAALAMRAAMAEYNSELARELDRPLAFGIGVHSGPGLAGFVGSSDRMDYDFIGHTVNVAARVQTLTRLHGVDILVTEAVRRELDERIVLDAMPAEPVKGIAEPIVTYAVRDIIVASRDDAPRAHDRSRPQPVHSRASATVRQ